MSYGSGVAVSCGVSFRCGLDPELLWLWCRLAAAAPVRPLAWELPHALKRQKRKKKKNPNNKKFTFPQYLMLIYFSLGFLLLVSTVGRLNAGKFHSLLIFFVLNMFPYDLSLKK